MYVIRVAPASQLPADKSYSQMRLGWGIFHKAMRQSLWVHRKGDHRWRRRRIEIQPVGIPWECLKLLGTQLFKTLV